MSHALNAVDVTNYYAAINELAAMLADHEIGYKEWLIQRNLLHFVWHE